jgi:hypothetical protein
MSDSFSEDAVERLARRRAHASQGLAMAFLAIQATDAANARSNGQVDLPFALWAILLLVILLFGGGWFRGARIRNALNDETPVVHRRMAMACGFLITLGGAFIIYLLSFYEEVTAPEALRLVITFAVSGALLRFAGLEKRALRQ